MQELNLLDQSNRIHLPIITVPSYLHQYGIPIMNFSPKDEEDGNYWPAITDDIINPFIPPGQCKATVARAQLDEVKAYPISLFKRNDNTFANPKIANRV